MEVAETPETKRPLILIVDDQQSMRKLLHRIMESEGYQIIEARNGQEAIALYQETLPDIVLLDAIMPIMDGFTCCQKLQSLSRYHLSHISPAPNQQNCVFTQYEDETEKVFASLAQTPILMITALENTDSVNRAFEAGATDYVTKPIHYTVLQHRVRRLLERSRLYKQLNLANKKLNRLANLDGLTELPNRRRFDEYLKKEWQRMARKQNFLSLLLCDIDYFKPYNDTYGHQAGDDCLKKVAHLIDCEVKRPGDLVARYGGEEIAVILPETHAQGALNVAQRINLALRKFQLEHIASPVSPHVSLSIGVATLSAKLSIAPTVLIELADQALYQAKAGGRDTIRVSSSI